MKILFAFAILALVGSLTAFGQTAQEPESKIVLLPKITSHRPKVTLQEGLRIAEKFIKDEKLDVSNYYLMSAKYILYGSDGTEAEKAKRRPCWFFWWVHEDGSIGKYVEIIVDQDSGLAGRLPSM